MKITQFAWAFLLCISFMACSSEEKEDIAENPGTLDLKFDNGVGNQDFIFGTSYNKSNGESYRLTTLKYIISNVRVKDSKGNLFTYPTADNVFIIDEANANNAGAIIITLQNVPAADYTEITFGIGIDQARFLLGAEGQGDFLLEADEAGMLWSWATGYRFIRLDGLYTTSTVTDEALAIHMGSVGTSLDNYREVTLPFPNSVRVRENAHPQAHIKADISKIFDGETSINFEDGYNQVHTSAETTPIIADNLKGIFEVHHVHN